MSETLRTFIAFNLPEKTIASIGDIQGKLKSYDFKIRWVPPQNMHLTLKFLGATPVSHIDKIKDAMVQSVSDTGPIHLAVNGVGIFPNLCRPRVLWAGITGDIDLLRALQQKLETTFSVIGYAKEKRPYRGHLTLGRFKGKAAAGKLQNALETFKDFRSQPFTLSNLCFIKSDLKPAGSEYTELLRVSLAL